ncbi:hypothetical protein Ancab_022711 [Ancistrocladus abbreviatus]
MKRLKIGSKVEILRKKNMPPGMWRSAEIVEHSGDNYIVRYDCGLGVGGEGTFQCVPWESIRPCPPMKDVVSWEVRDVVEVFNTGHWKVAVVLKAMGGGYYCVRLIGSFEEFIVKKSSIRVRQVWNDSKWVVIGKDYGTCKHVIHELHGKTITHTGGNFPVLPSRRLKRTLATYSYLDAYSTSFPKKRAVEKGGCSVQVLSEYSSLFLKKVDGAACFRENRGGKLVPPSSNVSVAANNVLNRGKQMGAHFYDRISQPNDSISIVSSVGSCSVFGCNPNSCPLAEDTDSLSSDAESFHSLVEDEASTSHSLEEEYGGERTPELQVYCCTLQTLYTSGPLSWEQEVYLTDLRSELHISDEQHLLVVRNLQSSGTAVHVS